MTPQELNQLALEVAETVWNGDLLTPGAETIKYFAKAYRAALMEKMEPVCFMGHFDTKNIREAGVVVTRNREDLAHQDRGLPDRIDALYSLEDWK